VTSRRTGRNRPRGISEKIERAIAGLVKRRLVDKKMSMEKDTGNTAKVTGKSAGTAGAKRPRGEEGESSQKVVKLQDLQAPVLTLVQQALSVPGTSGMSKKTGAKASHNPWC